MDTERVHMLRQALSHSGWIERTRDFAQALRRVPEPGGLLLVGTPQEEPWHLAAHLGDEARLTGLEQLRPTLVRWAPPLGAPAHLAVTMRRLEEASRRETVFVVAPDKSPDELLERVSDARKVGATVLSIDSGDDELASLTHERLLVPRDASEPLVTTTSVSGRIDIGLDIDAVTHLVSVAAGETESRFSFRDRLARLLEKVSGPAPSA